MDEAKPISSWLGALLGLIALALAFKQVIDLDFFWHLATGRWLATHGIPVRADVFSFTFPDQPWVDLTWGFELLIHTLYRAVNGTWLISAFMAVLAAVNVILAWQTFETLRAGKAGGRLTGFLIFLTALPLVDIRWIHRPEAFTHCLGSALLLWLVRGGPLWIVPTLQIVWVNAHGLFVLGPLLIGTFLVASVVAGNKKQAGRLSLALGLSIAACVVNPRGLEGTLFPLHLWNVLNDPFFKTTIPEATPPLHGPVWSLDAWGFAIYLAVGCLLFAMRGLRQRHHGRPSERAVAGVLLFAIMAYLALPARRNIALFLIWTLPWLAEMAAEAVSWVIPSGWRHRITAGRALLFSTTLAGALLFAIVTNLFRPEGSVIRFGGGLAPHHHPERSAEALSRLPRPPVLFSGVHFADYMLFAQPGFRSYLDGRFAEMYPKRHFQRFMEVLAHPPEIEKEADAHGINGVALELSNPMDQGLIRYLAHAPKWTLYYFDETAVIFLSRSLRREPSDPKALMAQANEAITRSFGQPESPWDRVSLRREGDRASAFARLAQALILLGESALADNQLSTALSLSPAQPLALTLNCINQFGLLEQKAAVLPPTEVVARLASEIGQVRSDCEAALQKGSERDAPAMTLGLLAMNLGRFEDASRYFRGVSERSPTNYQAFLLLGRSYLAQGSAALPEAEHAYRRAIALRPLDPSPAKEWAQAQASIPGT